MQAGPRELWRLRQEHLAMVFQRFGLLPHRSVRDNVGYGLEVQRIGSAERVCRANETLELVGLGGWGDDFASSLSGGMQQRVGLARAIATEPKTAYGADFVAHADPTGVITAGTVAVGTEHERIDERSRQGGAWVVVHRTQADAEIVIDEDGRGITSRDDFERPEVKTAFDRHGGGRADLMACPPGWGREAAIDHHLDVYGLRVDISEMTVRLDAGESSDAGRAGRHASRPPRPVFASGPTTREDSHRIAVHFRDKRFDRAACL